MSIGLCTNSRRLRRFRYLQFTIQNIAQFLLVTTRAFGHHYLVLYVRENSADGFGVALLNKELRVFAVFGKKLLELFCAAGDIFDVKSAVNFSLVDACRGIGAGLAQCLIGRALRLIQSL